MKKRIKNVLLFCMIFFVLSIQSYAKEIMISETTATINVGDTLKLSLDGTDQVPKWTSWNVNIATVNQEGEITALKKGKTTIGVRVGATTEKCILNVVEPSIKLNKTKATIYNDKTSLKKLQLKATVKGASKVVTWESRNHAIATVDENGKVTPVSKGKTQIVATANGLSAFCNIEVKDSSITLNIDSMQLSTKGNGSSMKLIPTITGVTKNVIWESSDKTVATVKGGKVTGKGSGTAYIQAKANGVSAICKVVVIKDSISIHTEKELLYTGECKKLKTNAGKKDIVIWKSSNSNVISVDEKGNITAIGAGTAIITAALDGNVDTCRVTVKDTITSIKEDKITLSSNDIKLTHGLEYKIEGRKSEVIWKTSDKKIATVSKGKITAKKSGKVIITATANGISDSVELNINIKESTVTLNHKNYTLYTGKGNTCTLKPTIGGKIKKVIWESSDPQVAVVNAKGKVTAVGEGIAIITARVKDAQAICNITVAESKVLLGTDNLVLDKDETIPLTVDVIGYSQSIKYVSADPQIVTIKNGMITAKNYGETEIKVTANGVTSVCRVKVAACEHHYQEGIEIQQATCQEPGEYKFICDLCGNVKKEWIPLQSHAYGKVQVIAPTCVARGYTLHTCECGKFYKDTFVEITDHNWGEWEVVTEATEELKGEERRLCHNCKSWHIREIPKKPHVHVYSDMVVEPTCFSKGYIQHTCTCGYQYMDNYVEMLTHNINGDPICSEKWQLETDRTKMKCTLCDSYVVPGLHEYEINEKISEDNLYFSLVYDCKFCQKHTESYQIEIYLTELSQGNKGNIEGGADRIYPGFEGKINFNSYLDEELLRYVNYEVSLDPEQQYLKDYIKVSPEGILTVSEEIIPEDSESIFTVCITLEDNPRNASFNMSGFVQEEWKNSIQKKQYWLVDEKEANAHKKIKQVISEIIVEGMNDAEKVLAVHDWMCLNVKYDYEAFRNSAVRPESYFASGAILNGKAVCGGYSLAFYDFMKLLNIPCKYIISNSMDHAWNHVFLDGEWYWLDTTHDDVTIEDESYSDYIRYDYLLLNGKRTEDEYEFGKEDVNICNGSYWREAVFENYIANTEEEIEEVMDSQGDLKLKHIAVPYDMKKVVIEKYPEYTCSEPNGAGIANYCMLILWKP